MASILQKVLSDAFCSKQGGKLTLARLPVQVRFELGE